MGDHDRRVPSGTVTQPDETIDPNAGPTRPPLAGRYRLGARLGAGGMGEVFAAHDPELGRTVAVKLLVSGLEGTERARERLRREAQTMARLSHPNVIQVYDVGVDEGRVFIAMEYVAGGTLQEWLDRPRPVADIVRMFAQAARGLAAAHEVGLVHRDFKPSNVLVAAGERCLVTDFGIARPSENAAAETVDEGAVGAPFQTITRQGGVIGTPLYMAPEQHAGGAVDARADQFSFCAALWDAVYGTMPFSGTTLDLLREAKSAGRLAPPPADAKVPPHVAAALERGLRPSPADRFPSMQALIDALTDDPGQRRRRRLRQLATLAGVLAVGFASALLVARVRSAPRDVCATSEDRFAGVWDAASARAVHDAFVRTGGPDFETIFRSTARRLDARRAAWLAMRRESCEATRVRKDQSDAAFDLRAACLDRRLAELGAFVDTLRHADVAVLRQAALASGVGDVSVCADVAALSRRAALPAAPERRAAILALDARRAALESRVLLGHWREAADDVHKLVEEARAAGYAPLLAQCLSLEAWTQILSDRHAEGVRLFDEALLSAEAGGDDALRFDIEMKLTREVGKYLEKDEAGQEHGQRAEALLARLGNDPRREALLEGARASVDAWHGRYALARRRGEHSVGLLERIDPGGADLMRAWFSLGQTLKDMEDDTAALAAFERSLALGRGLLGEDDPNLAKAWQGAASALSGLGRYDEAERDFHRALDVFMKTSGPESIDVAATIGNLGIQAEKRGHTAEAIASYRRALAIKERILDPDDSRIGDSYAHLGAALSKENDPQAVPMLERVIAIKEKRLGPDHLQTADAIARLGLHYLDHHQPARALPLFERSVRAIQASQGKDSDLAGEPQAYVGDTLVALGRVEDAIAAYERALTLMGPDYEDRGFKADTEFSLARALRTAKRDPGRAEALARSARAYYAGPVEGAAEARSRIDAWLAGPTGVARRK
jgi:tetratricopeptide (TPR) repeat protein